MRNGSLHQPAWRNWQTRWTQNPVLARVCGFEPLRRHHLRRSAKEIRMSKLATGRVRPTADTKSARHDVARMSKRREIRNDLSGLLIREFEFVFPPSPHTG